MSKPDNAAKARELWSKKREAIPLHLQESTTKPTPEESSANSTSQPTHASTTQSKTATTSAARAPPKAPAAQVPPTTPAVQAPSKTLAAQTSSSTPAAQTPKRAEVGWLRMLLSLVWICLNKLLSTLRYPRLVCIANLPGRVPCSSRYVALDTSCCSWESRSSKAMLKVDNRMAGDG